MLLLHIVMLRSLLQFFLCRNSTFFPATHVHRTSSRKYSNCKKRHTLNSHHCDRSILEPPSVARSEKYITRTSSAFLPSPGSTCKFTCDYSQISTNRWCEQHVGGNRTWFELMLPRDFVFCYKFIVMFVSG